MNPCPKTQPKKKRPPVDWSGFAVPKVVDRKKGAAYHKEREKVFARDGHICCLPDCRSRFRVNMGHIKGRGRGGSDTAGNMVAMCDLDNVDMESGLLKITWDGTTPTKIERRRNPEHPWTVTYERSIPCSTTKAHR